MCTGSDLRFQRYHNVLNDPKGSKIKPALWWSTGRRSASAEQSLTNSLATSEHIDGERSSDQIVGIKRLIWPLHTGHFLVFQTVLIKAYYSSNQYNLSTPALGVALKLLCVWFYLFIFFYYYFFLFLVLCAVFICNCVHFYYINFDVLKSITKQSYLMLKLVSALTLSTLGKIFSRRHFEIFFLFFSENRIWHFMQIVS